MSVCLTCCDVVKALGARKVVGVEMVEQAVQDARVNAETNGTNYVYIQSLQLFFPFSCSFPSAVLSLQLFFPPFSSFPSAVFLSRVLPTKWWLQFCKF